MNAYTRAVNSSVIHTALVFLLGAIALLASVFPNASAAEPTPSLDGLKRTAPQQSDGQSATQLPDGRWLLIGGTTLNRVSADARMIDVRANQTNILRNGLTEARRGHTATVLPDGAVFVFGGTGVDGNVVSSVERFDPNSSRFERVGIDLMPRAQHSATLLTDGRLLIVGGYDRNGALVNEVEVVNTITWQIERFDARMETARFGHFAALLPTEPVLIWGGFDSANRPVRTSELFDLQRTQFYPLADSQRQQLQVAPNAPQVTGVFPNPDTVIDLDATVGVRFSRLMAGPSLNPKTVTLIGPNGTVPVEVVTAEEGRLAFVTPKQDLNPQATYTLFIRGAVDQDARPIQFTALAFRTGTVESLVRNRALMAASGVKALPTNPPPVQTDTTDARSALGGSSRVTISEASTADSTSAIRSQLAINEANARDTHLSIPGFQLPESAKRGCGQDSAEDWMPSLETIKRTGWNMNSTRPVVIPRELARFAPNGVTALSGQVLRLSGLPLAGVTVTIGDRTTMTDEFGLFVLRNVPKGKQVLIVDGTSASCAGAAYGQYEIQANINAGGTNVLPFPVWMSKLDKTNEVTIASPTVRDAILTNPHMPGLEVRIPAGTIIRDRNGRIVNQISITAIPNDRPPYPMPEFAEFPVYFTIQPGGARLEGVDGRPRLAIVTYPNYGNAVAESRFTFWNYDPSDRGWHEYGKGKVSPDGRLIKPDDEVGLYVFRGFSATTDPNPEPCTCDCCGGDNTGGKGGSGGGGSGPLSSNAGDPVHTATGQFVHVNNDFSIPDVMPLNLTRLYFSQDGRSREFGYGMMSSLDMYLYSPGGVSNTQTMYLITSKGGRVKFDCSISDCTTFSTAEHEARTDPGPFYKSTLRYEIGRGWIISTIDGMVYRFYQPSHLRSISDRFGNTITYVRDAPGGGPLRRVVSPNGRSIEFTYDASNRITEATDNTGRKWTYLYDASGRMTKATNPLGDFWQYTWDGTSYRIKTVIDPRGNAMEINDYDANGRVIKQTYANGTTSLFSYVVDPGTNMVTQAEFTDERATIRRMAFDTHGRISTNTYAVGKPEQQITTVVRQTPSNLMQSMTDPLGRQTSYTYNANGQVLTRTQLAGTANAVTTTYTYGTAFNLVTSIQDPNLNTTLLTYDALGNLTQIKDANLNTTAMTYDVQGRIATAKSGSLPVTTYVYEGPDLKTITDPLSRVITMLTDGAGRVISVKDPLGNTTTTEYDTLNRVKKITDPLGNFVSFAYDPNGKLTSHTDHKGNVTQYSYDTQDRLLTKTDALLKVDTYGYDAAGSINKVTDRKSQVTGMTYDALSRRTQVGYGATIATPTTYANTISYTYDAGDRMTQANDTTNGIITRAYDGLNRMTSEATPQGTVTYTYDAGGRRTSMVVPNYGTINYSYDLGNRLTAITKAAPSPQTVSFAYDTANRRTKITLPNAIDINYVYDNASQLSSITYVKTSAPSATLGDLTYTYDAAGRRTSIGGTFSRTNVPAATAAANVTHNANNQLTAWGAASATVHTYDFNGNLTGDGTYTYTWNARNQLITVKQGATTVAAYDYDAFGRRRQKAITLAGVTTTTRFLYDGVNFVQEQDGTGAAKANLLIGMGYDQVYARTLTGVTPTTSSFLMDHLGTIIAEVDAVAAIQTSYTYEPYGKTTQTGVASTNAQRYTGREQDFGDLYFYRARYYSAGESRFNSEDPIGIRGGINLYGYADFDPASKRDPTGNLVWVIPPILSIIGPIVGPVIGTGIGIGVGLAITQACQNDDPDGCRQRAGDCRSACTVTLPTYDYGIKFQRCWNRCMGDCLGTNY
jgi:RHS repeat-associated protein